MFELVKLIKKKYKEFDITPQHLDKVLRDNNKTRKRTRHEHFPKTKYPFESDGKMTKSHLCLGFSGPPCKILWDIYVP